MGVDWTWRIPLNAEPPVSTAEVRAVLGMSKEIDRAAAVDRWLDPDGFRERLKNVSDEDLPVLYEQVKSIADRAWQCQALVVAEMMKRSRYGERTAEAVKEELGLSSVRSVQYRAKIGEMLADPDCASAGVILQGPTWWRLATEASDPKAALLHAAEQKASDPGYSTRQFEATIRQHSDLTVSRIVLVCNGTEADMKAADRLHRQYNAIVEMRNAVDSAPFGIYNNAR